MDYLLFLILTICLILTCYILGKIPEKYLEPFTSLQRQSNLDALRGLLAVFVLTHHFYITYIWKTSGEWRRPESDLLNNLGAASVSLFFLVTGYLFINKVMKESFNWRKLYKSRFKRLMPMFYFTFFIVAIITFLSLNDYPPAKKIINWVFSWLKFKGGSLAGFDSGRVIAYVNWTLLYEWAFYFSLPLIHTLIYKKVQSKWILIITSILFISIFSTSKQSLYVLFLLSFASIFLQDALKRINKTRKPMLNILVPILMIVGFVFLDGYTLMQKIVLSIVFAFVVNGYDFFGLLHNKGLKILGDISYSIYLVHGVVLYLMFTIIYVYDFHNGLLWYFSYLPIVLSLVIGISLMTYNFIERPFLKNT